MLKYREPVKKRRVLFNWDRAPLNFGEYPISKEDFLRYVFEPLENSHVDAVFWCAAQSGNEANYQSKVLQMYGHGHGFRFDNASVWRISANTRHLIEQGNDPCQLVVEGARERGIDVFVSLRLNDTHDVFMPDEMPAFKREHPEWMLGDACPELRTALNFALKEVRDFKLRIIEEYFQQYNFDGIEIDFLRGPYFFKPKQEFRHRYALTDFLANVRQCLDEIGRKRGRRIEVAARVDENIDVCHHDGFDVECWVNKSLVDIFIIGSGAIDIDVIGFKKLVAGTPIRIYPCLYAWMQGYNPYPDEVLRAHALKYWQDEPDGLYTFNWFPYKEFETHLLKEIGEPQILKRKDKRYLAESGIPGTHGYPNNWAFSTLPVELHITQIGRGPVIPITIGDDIVSAEKEKILEQVKMRFRFEGYTKLDRLEFHLNDHLLSEHEIEPIDSFHGHGNPLHRAGGHVWLKFKPEPGLFCMGRNKARVTLLERNREMKSPLRLMALEIDIVYRK